jgi:hypothetical protein
VDDEYKLKICDRKVVPNYLAGIAFNPVHTEIAIVL